MNRRHLLASFIGATALAFAQPALAQKTLTFLTWNAPSNAPMFKDWIETFEAQNPGVKVQWVDKPGTEWPAYYQTQLVAGSPPDLINVQANLWVEYATNDVILDLSDRLKKEPEVHARYNPDFLRHWQLDGRQYLLPYYVNKTVMFYNKPLLESAGVKAMPKTLDELLEVSRKVAGTGQQNAGLLSLNFDWMYWPLFAAAGVEFTTADGSRAAFNTPQALQVLNKLAKATADGAISKVSWTGRWRENNAAFASGTVAMYLAHGGAYWNFKNAAKWVSRDTIGVGEFPGRWGVVLPHGWAISKGSKNPDLAWAFLKHITSDEVAGRTAKRLIRGTGNKKADAALREHLKSEDPRGLDIIDVHSASFDRVTGGPKSPVDAQLQEVFWPEIQSALLGQKEPKQALDDAEARVNRLLRRAR
jgi:ABC-type glycerol-3-phosphate transport system substrate-binding protein